MDRYRCIAYMPRIFIYSPNYLHSILCIARETRREGTKKNSNNRTDVSRLVACISRLLFTWILCDGHPSQRSENDGSDIVLWEANTRTYYMNPLTSNISWTNTAIDWLLPSSIWLCIRVGREWRMQWSARAINEKPKHECTKRARMRSLKFN